MTHRYKYLLFLLLPDTHLPGVVVVNRFLNGSSFSTNALDLLRKLVYLLLSHLNELPREVIASTCLIRLTLVLFTLQSCSYGMRKYCGYLQALT